MQNLPLLGPAAVLILWTLILMFWMMAARLGAFSKAGITLTKVPVGGRYADIENQMPDSVNWKSHNYTHLMEQPTLFYAVVAVLSLAGDISTTSVFLAWSYTVIRIVHSIWQSTINIVAVRAALFAVSCVCLLGLAINGVRMTLF